MTERHMASHPSVTQCDVSAPWRHIVTSRHTPLRGVTDVTCDAGVRDHRIPPTGRPIRTAIEPYVANIKASGHFHHIDIDSIMFDPTCGSVKGHPRGRVTWDEARPFT
jgi:hypothetical protein